MNEAAAAGEEALARGAGGAMLYDASCLHHPDTCGVRSGALAGAGRARDDARRARHGCLRAREPGPALGAAPLSPRRTHCPSLGRPLRVDRCRPHALVQGVAPAASTARLGTAGAHARGGEVPACRALLPRRPDHRRIAGAPYADPGAAAGAVAGRDVACDRPVRRFAACARRAARGSERAQPARRREQRHLRARLRSRPDPCARSVGTSGARALAALVAEGHRRPAGRALYRGALAARCWPAPGQAEHTPCDCCTSC